MDKKLALLSEYKEKTYIIVDFSHNKELWLEIDEYFNESICLYEKVSPELEQISPHLLQVNFENVAQQKWLKEKVLGKNMALFIQTNASMESFDEHFSNIAVIWNEESETHHAGKAYFAFYDPRVFDGFVRGLGRDTKAFFASVETFYIEDEFEEGLMHSYSYDDEPKNIICKTVETNKGNASHIRIAIEEEQFGLDFGQEEYCVLTAWMRQNLKAHEERRQSKRMAYQIQKEFSTYFTKEEMPSLLSRVYDSTSHMKKYGFSQYKYLYTLATWEIFYGKGFEKNDPKGILENICMGSKNETDKFTAFETRMLEFDRQEETQRSQ